MGLATCADGEPNVVPVAFKDVTEDSVEEKYYVNTPKANELIETLIDSGKLEKDISNTVRAGGGEEA